MLDNSSLGVVSHQLHQSWKPQLQHLVATIATLDFDVCLHHSLGIAAAAVDRKEKRKTMPFSVNLMRSQVLHWAAQDSC